MNRVALSRVIRKCAPFLAMGLVYLAVCFVTGYSLPCPFHAVTGLYCPGCGVTTMALSLAQGDIRAAFAANPALFAAVPVIAADILRAELQPLRHDDTLTYGLIVYFLLFAVYRNL